MTFGPTYQSTSHSVLQFPIAFKLGMKYPKIPINGYSNLDFSISACGNRSSQFLIYWDMEWWNTVSVYFFYYTECLLARGMMTMSCPLDPCLPMPMPAGSPHARVHAQWIHAHPCLCPLNPCMLCLCLCLLDPSTPCLCLLGPCMPVPMPAGSPHACARARWIPACLCSCPLDPCMPCLCLCLLDPSTLCLCLLGPCMPVPMPAGSPHACARARWIPACL